MKLFLKHIAFQILFYRGSQVDKNIYSPVISQMNQMSGKNISFVDYQFFKRNHFEEDVFLIGHSFGGYFALLDYFKNKDKVKGLVLLNSHFNSKKKAIYPGIKQEDIDIPVLTILGSKDNRLPIKTAIYDLFEKSEKNLRDKYYIIEPQGGHFWGMDKEKEKLAKYIIDFYKDVVAQNFTETRKNTLDTEKNFTYDFFNILPNTINFNWSLDLFDGLLKIIMPEYLWIYYHYLWFLYSKPTNYYNIQFYNDDAIFFKTKNIEIDEMISSFERNLPIKDKKIIKLPTLGISLPVWLLYYPQISKDSYDIVYVKINNDTCYYKFPNPNRLNVKFRIL